MKETIDCDHRQTITAGRSNATLFHRTLDLLGQTCIIGNAGWFQRLHGLCQRFFEEEEGSSEQGVLEKASQVGAQIIDQGYDDIDSHEEGEELVLKEQTDRDVDLLAQAARPD